MAVSTREARLYDTAFAAANLLRRLGRLTSAPGERARQDIAATVERLRWAMESGPGEAETAPAPEPRRWTLYDESEDR